MPGPSFRERVREAAAAQHINQPGEGLGPSLAAFWGNVGPAFLKDMQTLPERAGSVLMQPVQALDRFGRTLMGQEGGYGLEYDPALGRVAPSQQLFDDAATLGGFAQMNPAVPANAFGMGFKGKMTGSGGIKAYHATDAEFDAFDWSQLGRNTRQNITDASDDSWAMNLARAGVWASDRDISSSLRSRFSKEVKLTGAVGKFDSLDKLEAAIRRAGGPDKFRDRMRAKGVGVIQVQDEEMGGTSYVAIDPENISVTRTINNDPVKIIGKFET